MKTKLRLLALTCSLCVFLNAPTKADFDPPKQIGQSTPSRKSVALIYYANESDPEALRPIRDWVAHSDVENSQAWLKKIDRDIAVFPSSVQAQAQQLGSLVSSDASKSVALIVFTNRLARRGVYRTWTPQTKSWVEHEFELDTPKLKALHHHPLSNERSLELALEKVENHFPSTEFEYVLICKSHGSEKIAMGSLSSLKLGSKGPVLGRPTSQQSEQETAGTQPNVHDPLEDQAIHDPLDDQSINDPLDDQGIAGHTADPRITISKRELTSILVEANKRRGTKFQALILDSCSSQLPEEMEQELSQAVQWLVASEGGTRFDGIDYGAVRITQEDIAEAVLNLFRER